MTTIGGKTPTEVKRPKGREESEQHEDDQDEPGLTHREEESENVLIQPDLPLQSSSTTRYYSTVAKGKIVLYLPIKNLFTIILLSNNCHFILSQNNYKDRGKKGKGEQPPPGRDKRGTRPCGFSSRRNVISMGNGILPGAILAAKP